MSNTAFLTVNSSFGYAGQHPPNAWVNADGVVKDDKGDVILSEGGIAQASLDVGDNYATILAKLTSSIRQTMNDPDLQVVFL